MAFEIEIIVVKRPVGTLRPKYSGRGRALFHVVPGDKMQGEFERLAMYSAVDTNEALLLADIDVAIGGYGTVIK